MVQAEASVLCSSFGLFASPTNNILEQTATGICPFADIDVICLRTPGPVAQIMLKLASPRRYEKSKDVTFEVQSLLVSAGVSRKGRLFLNVARILKRANNRNLFHFGTLGYWPFGDIKGGGAAEMRSISDGPALVSEVCQTGQSRGDRCCKILFRLMFSRRVCPMSISCPSCSSQRIHRSRRKGFLESGPLTLMFVRPFRCEQCDHRFFRLSFSANPGVPPAGRTWLPLVRGR